MEKACTEIPNGNKEKSIYGSVAICKVKKIGRKDSTTEKAYGIEEI